MVALYEYFKIDASAWVRANNDRCDSLLSGLQSFGFEIVFFSGTICNGPSFTRLESEILTVCCCFYHSPNNVGRGENPLTRFFPRTALAIY